jgi:FkbM family methyltransferase
MKEQVKSVLAAVGLLEAAQFINRRVIRRSEYRRQEEWKLRAARDERDTARVLRDVLRSDSCTVDVGAHKGKFLRKLLDAAPMGVHTAFEALPHYAGELRARFPGVRVLEYAVSDQAGSMDFYLIPGFEGWSGLRVQEYPISVKPERLTVQSARDSFFGPEDRIDFVKIDVEGAELGVLRGAKATILRARPVIYFEYAIIHAREYGVTPEDMYGVLESELEMNVYSLSGARLAHRDFVSKCRTSHASGYDRHAETNFLARPASLE